MIYWYTCVRAWVHACVCVHAHMRLWLQVDCHERICINLQMLGLQMNTLHNVLLMYWIPVKTNTNTNTCIDTLQTQYWEVETA